MADSVLVSPRSLRRGATRSGGYLVATHPAPATVEQVVNPRRGSSLSVPLASWKQQAAMQDDILTWADLGQYVGCTTAEMSKRPVPHVFETARTQKLADVYEKWLPLLYIKWMPTLKAPTQPFNKTSRLGWPHFGRPTSKKPWVMAAYKQICLDGDLDWMADAFIIMNVRLQPEPKDKKRDFLFVSQKGEVYEETVDRTQYMVDVSDIGERVPARTRLVFNYPLPNLVKQVVDTAINNGWMQYRFCSHNMYDRSVGFSRIGKIFCFDVKHFERHTATCAAIRAAYIGGAYADIANAFRSMPFLCPADNWKTKVFLWPDRDSGVSEQYGSGDSAVAPVQKEILLALMCQFVVEHFGYNPARALEWALGGGDHRLIWLNYGDDNATFGDSAVQKAFFTFLQAYLDVEEELPAKFLGFLWTDNGWRLGVQSYLLKTYLNERAPTSKYSRSPFRKYPCYGWVLKRQVYRDYGVPAVKEKVFMYEDRLLERNGLSWSQVETEARIEQAQLSQAAALGITDPNWIMGKDYLMTPEQKVQTGYFEGMSPSETGPMLQNLLGTDWLKMVRF